jgi:Tol biopolymer transport system component
LPAPPRRGRLAAIVLGAVLVTAVITTAIVKPRAPATGGEPVRRFDVIGGPFNPHEDTPPALSPDGQKVVFVLEGRLWVRRLNQLEPQRLDGTEGATNPAWSPDSESIVFCAENDLKSISIRGGSTTTLAIGVGSIAGGRSIAWGPNGRIAFTTPTGLLAEASARGGDFQTILNPEEGSDADFHEISFLPDGSILFVVHRATGGTDTLAVLTGNTRKTVIQIDKTALSHPTYSSTGHIVFRRGKTKTGLWAVPFSLAKLETTGEPFLITPNGSMPSAADDGTLLYVTDAGSSLFHLAWVDREGVVDGEPASLPMSGIRSPAISPDSTRVAVMGSESETDNIWVYDIVRKTRTRLTFGTNDWDPVWTPDGERIVFWDGATRALSIKAADGTGELERLVAQELSDSGNPSISPDGKWMAFWVQPTNTTDDIWYMPLDGDRVPVPMLNSSFVEGEPRISPDGNFLAYYSEESGKAQIYLTRFPSGDGKWQVSVEGGRYPVWSSKGNELFFLNRTLLMQVDVVTDPSVQLGTPRALFDAAKVGVEVTGEARFDVSRDAQRFLMVQAVKEESVTPHLVISYDWLNQFRDRD